LSEGTLISQPETIFVAAENGLLPGAKVGGVADVIRDLPAAVATQGARATILTPSYGTLHRLPGARPLEIVATVFRGRRFRARVFEVPVEPDNVRCLVIDHRVLAPTDPGVVYHGDDANRPYATDANKFAFFCAAVASWIITRPQEPAVVHLHDWHCGVLAVLRRFDARYLRLARIPTVFTIHNLAYQGQRPLRDDPSSLHAWFPALRYEASSVTDPEFTHVFNPMAAAIRLCDRVNTVSPTYAREICRPSDPATGFIGGEGLEADLRRREQDGTLMGILNGCNYPATPAVASPWKDLRRLIGDTLDGWQQRERDPAFRKMHANARKRLDGLGEDRPPHLLTSVGRIVDQKMRLMFTRTPAGVPALAALLERLPDDALLILLGSGEPRFEAELARIAAKQPKLLFLRGYSEAVGEALYASGDLFLMPSSFEPCGISQMLSMRAGQPCVVHAVGGLRDTVRHGETGFVFDGQDPSRQAGAFVDCAADAVALRDNDPSAYARIRDGARASRFPWDASARHYLRKMYELG